MLSSVQQAIAKAGKDKKVRNFYPGLFADELQEVPAQPGITEVYSAEGQFLAVGYYDPKSRVALRVYR